MSSIYASGSAPVKEENGCYYDYSTELIRELETGKIQAIIPGKVPITPHEALHCIHNKI